MSRQYSASSSSGATPPATNVRVMSAQQRDSRSRGQMSTTTASPAASAPKPDSCPSADWGPWATITSPGRSHPRSSQASVIAARISSDVRPGRSSWIRSAATAIAASAAFCARRMPASWASVFARRRSTNASGSTSSVHAARAQVVGDPERELGRHDRPLHAQLAARAQRDLEVDLVPAQAAREQLVGAERGGVEHVDPERADLVGVEHAHGRRAAAAASA